MQLLLPHIDSVIYVDTDTLFISPPYFAWSQFYSFNESQIAALTPEHEDRNVGWYNRFARHPFYGPMGTHLFACNCFPFLFGFYTVFIVVGVNSGVMLMNLTRMRKFKWEEYILPLHKEYKLKLTWGDQDIINILFYFHSGK